MKQANPARFPAARKYRAEQIEGRDRCMQLARTFRSIGDAANAAACVRAARASQHNALRIARIFN